MMPNPLRFLGHLVVILLGACSTAAWAVTEISFYYPVAAVEKSPRRSMPMPLLLMRT